MRKCSQSQNTSALNFRPKDFALRYFFKTLSQYELVSSVDFSRFVDHKLSIKAWPTSNLRFIVMSLPRRSRDVLIRQASKWLRDINKTSLNLNLTRFRLRNYPNLLSNYRMTLMIVISYNVYLHRKYSLFLRNFRASRKRTFYSIVAKLFLGQF